MDKISTKDFNIPLDKKILLDLNYEQVNLIMKSLTTACETFKVGSKFLVGKDKQTSLNAIQDFTTLSAYIESVLLNYEVDEGGTVA